MYESWIINKVTNVDTCIQHWKQSELEHSTFISAVHSTLNTSRRGQTLEPNRMNRRNERWMFTLFSVLNTFIHICRVYLGVKTCEVFLCFVAIVRVRAIVLTSLFSLFYVTGEGHRFLHRGWAICNLMHHLCSCYFYNLNINCRCI